ncbi:tetratricopeptide repeat protein [Hyalangium rubrum]|uniref:tetratricopeptide repeat protein n=1 Tax=Hyalangium rubrum TaxID=3103134 RepID=UPI003BF51329
MKRLPILRRLLAVAPLCTLAACATDSAMQTEMAALRSELRTMREQQSRLGDRLERLERSTSVIRARSAPQGAQASSGKAAPAPTPAAPAPAPQLEVPDLTVVKLKPKNEPAPSLSTRVAVVEPDEEQAEVFVSGSSESDSGSAPAASAPVNTAALDSEFEQALSVLRTGNTELGVVKLRAFAEQNPRHSRADNALYFSGLGMIGLNDHSSAASLFERLIQTYPAGDAVLDGMLRLAECRLKLKQPEDARALYTRVITQFPGTAAATQAEQRLASLSP